MRSRTFLGISSSYPILRRSAHLSVLPCLLAIHEALDFPAKGPIFGPMNRVQSIASKTGWSRELGKQ